MQPCRTTGAVTALLLAMCGTSVAQEPSSEPSLDLGSPAPWTAAAFGPGSRLSSPPLGLVAGAPVGPPAGALFGGPAVPRFEAVRYQPRYRPPPSSGTSSAEPAPSSKRGPAEAHLQLHAGFIERDGDGPTSFAVGLRFGPSIGDVVQLGLGVDWYHESESEREVVGSAVQGGRPVTTTNVLARTNADLVPIQAHIQLGGAGRVPLGIYVGAGGGYQYLMLSADDYATNTQFDATYGGWGWQAWGGIALRLSSTTRLFGEVFRNTGLVERDVNDPATGLTFREGTDTDGVGMRFGLNFGI